MGIPISDEDRERWHKEHVQPRVQWLSLQNQAKCPVGTVVWARVTSEWEGHVPENTRGVVLDPTVISESGNDAVIQVRWDNGEITHAFLWNLRKTKKDVPNGLYDTFWKPDEGKE